MKKNTQFMLAHLQTEQGTVPIMFKLERSQDLNHNYPYYVYYVHIKRGPTHVVRSKHKIPGHILANYFRHVRKERILLARRYLRLGLGDTISQGVIYSIWLTPH